MILKGHQTEKNVILRMFADYWETFKVAYPTYDNNYYNSDDSGYIQVLRSGVRL